MSNQSKINCPKCNIEIDVNGILYNQLKTELETKINSDLNEDKRKVEKQEQELKSEKDNFEKRKLKENDLFQERLSVKLKEEKGILEKSIKAKIDAENSEQLLLLQKELNEKSEQVKS